MATNIATKIPRPRRLTCHPQGASQLGILLIGLALTTQALARVEIAPADLALGGEADLISVTRVSSKAVTAVRAANDDLKVIAWEVGENGELTRQGEARAGGVDRIAVTDWPQGPGVVTAVRTTGGTLKVIAWRVSSDGIVTREGEDSAGEVSEVSISSPNGFGGVVTPVRDGSGDLRVIAWHVSPSGEVTRAGDAGAGGATRISTTAMIPSFLGPARIATAFRNQTDNLQIITWAVDTQGNVQRLAPQNPAVAGTIQDVVITYRGTATADLLTASRGADGDLTVIGWELNADESLTRLTTARGYGVGAVSVTTWKPDLHTYAVVGLETASSSEFKLIVWRNGADLKRHGELTIGSAQEVALTTWSGGVVAVTRTLEGNLALRTFGLAPRGIKLIHQQWPPADFVPVPPDLVVDDTGRVDIYGRIPDISTNTASGDDSDGLANVSPPWQFKFYPEVQGVDPMLAVGHHYVLVSQDHRIGFFAKTGQPLPSKAGEATSMRATTFFSDFINDINADGSPADNNINHYSPQLISEFYDARVYYDTIQRRFAVLAAARKPGTEDTRYLAFAVSRTEDPRDGFFQYMTTESNFRDFPRLVIHGNQLLMAHNRSNQQPSEGETPALYSVDYQALLQGDPDPPNWQYYPSDLRGAGRMFLVNQQGASGGLTLLLDIRSDVALRIVGYPTALNNHWLTPTPLFQDVALENRAPWPGPFANYRDGKLYVIGNKNITERVPDVRPPRNSVRTVIVPFSSLSTSEIVVDQNGIVDHFFGLNALSDAPGDKVTYDHPGAAINKWGDIIYVYGRTGIETADPLFPEARYSVWLAGEAKPRRSRLLDAGLYMPMKIYHATGKPPENVATPRTHIDQLDYATAIIDPVDDETFWIIQEFADPALASSKGYDGWRTVVATVNPRSQKVPLWFERVNNTLFWPASELPYELQAAETLDGPWLPVAIPSRREGDLHVFEVGPTNRMQFYRLIAQP